MSRREEQRNIYLYDFHAPEDDDKLYGAPGSSLQLSGLSTPGFHGRQGKGVSLYGTGDVLPGDRS